jgi:hypothetical protein
MEEKMSEKTKKIKHELRRHFTDAFAISTAYNPIQAIVETLGAKMSDAVSINSRLINAGLLFGGLASLSKLRDFSMRKFGIKEKTLKRYKVLHDALFAVPFVLMHIDEQALDSLRTRLFETEYDCLRLPNKVA